MSLPWLELHLSFDGYCVFLIFSILGKWQNMSFSYEFELLDAEKCCGTHKP